MSKPLITIGDGADRQVTVFRSRSGSLCFEFWDTDVGNACVDYDWESTQVFVEKDEEDKLFQELLKKQDRSALLWALLEEEAGELVEEYTEDLWSQGFRIGKDAVLLQSNKTEGKPDSLHPLRGYITDGKSFILCLARAIQEQRKREAGAQDA